MRPWDIEVCDRPLCVPCEKLGNLWVKHSIHAEIAESDAELHRETFVHLTPNTLRRFLEFSKINGLRQHSESDIFNCSISEKATTPFLNG